MQECSVNSLLGLIVLATSLSFATTAHALRCGNDLVSKGDRTNEVRRLCGAPQQVDKRRELRAYGVQDPVSGALLRNTAIVTISEWTYDFGPRRLVRLLRFENGRLVRIEVLGFGH